MSSAPKTVPDPKTGVAGSAVATTMGQPGGRVLTREDVPELLIGGRSAEEIVSLQLASWDEVERIVRELVDQGQVPAERFTFIR